MSRARQRWLATHPESVPAPRRSTPNWRKNGPERDFQTFAEARGWEVTKRGWPDFLCFKGDDLIVVEVKPRRANNSIEEVKPSQRRVMDALAAAGIQCFVSDGTRLERYVPTEEQGQS